MDYRIPPDSIRAILSTQLHPAAAERELVKLEQIHARQNRLYLERLLQLAAVPLSWQPIWLAQIAGELWLLDGHHRCVVAELRGQERILALVWK